MSTATPGAPPGVLGRAAAGAWHVPAGLAFLLRNTSLWSLALVPAVVAAVLLSLGFLAGAFLVPLVENRLAPPQARLPAVLGLVLTLSLWGGIVIASSAVGLALALLLTAPLLERLSRKVEAQLGGRGAGRIPAEQWEVAVSMRSGLVFLGAAVAAVGLAIVPVVGPLLGTAVAAPLLAYQATDPPLTRRGFGFDEKRAWHRRWSGEVVGFGLAALVALLVPLVNVLLPPALAVGAVRLVVELEELETAEGPGEAPPSAEGPFEESF